MSKWIKLIKASLSEEEKNKIIIYIRKNNFVPLEDNKYYFIVRLNDENIKMTDKFKSQLEQEDIYNEYYASGIAFNNELPISMDNLPIFGNSNKYDTSWFKSTPKDCLNSDLKDKQLNLSNRINKKVIKAAEEELEEYWAVYNKGQRISKKFKTQDEAREWAEMNFEIDDDDISIEKDSD